MGGRSFVLLLKRVLYYHETGEILAQIKRYDEAVKAFEEAIEINPNLFEVWYKKGIALYFLGKYDNAVMSFDNALILKPEYYEILNIKAWL